MDPRRTMIYRTSIKAKDDGYFVLVEMDANAKVGKDIIAGDNHITSNNGKLFLDVIDRQDLVIANSLDICKGIVTRVREFENRTEKSTIDYILTCRALAKDMAEMVIDEDRTYTLARYVKKKAGKKVIKSNHNILFGKFSIKFSRKPRKIRSEHFMFKCQESKKRFLNETNSRKLLSSSFHDKQSFLKCSETFFKSLDRTFHKCFQKVRIRNGPRKTYGDESIQNKLNLKTKLKIFLSNNKCDITREMAETKLNEVEEALIEEIAKKNATIVKEHVEQIEANDGGFTYLGF